jgi:hypothetical protein
LDAIPDGCTLDMFRFVNLVADRYFCQDPAFPAFAAASARLLAQIAPSIGGSKRVSKVFVNLWRSALFDYYLLRNQKARRILFIVNDFKGEVGDDMYAMSDGREDRDKGHGTWEKKIWNNAKESR